MRLGLGGRLRVRLGQRLLQILQGEFELVDPGAAFRVGPEALPSQPGDLQLQPFDRDLGHEPRCPLGQDHGVGGGEIGGKRRGLGRVRHAREKSILLSLCNALSSSDRTRTPALLRHPPVDAREQVAELRRRDRHGTVGRGRP